MFLLILRLGYLQIIKGPELQRLAFIQQNQGRNISPRRGTIYDRNYNELAVSASVETISVNPQDIKNKYNEETIRKIADKLSELLELTEKEKEEAYAKMIKASRYEIIKAKVDKSIGEKVRKWIQSEGIIGINVDEDSKRYYPNGNLAAHVIGFTRSDNAGNDGIEAIMEQYLKGVPGKILSEVDAGGRELPFKEETYIKPQDGLNVVLTIDETIQYFATKALDKAIADYNVLNGAVAIVMDPRNGDILALVSKPDYDLNNPRAAPVGIEGVNPETWTGTSAEDVKILQETVWRNKAVSDLYEPGSVFKAITAAAALEEGIVTPETRVNDRTVKVAGHNIDCWKPNFHGDESFTEAVYNSCNPVFVRLAQSLGIETFYKYVRAFGFYDTTKISLYGEAKGYFHAKPTEIDMCVASFGQRFQVTPLQVITAYAAIANGGELIRPRLVKELVDSEGNVVKTFETEKVRTVISKKTSDTLREILEGVVSKGTGRNAYVPGYRVAGKTGTSETTYSKNRYIASFSAFAPADNPVICVLVVLDNPTAIAHTGGVTAASVAGKLIEDILTYLEVERRYTEEEKKNIRNPVTVPEVRNMTLSDAKKQLSELGLEYKIEGSGYNNETIIMEQMPKPGATVMEKSSIILYTYKPETEVMVTVPDLSNKTVEEATAILNNLGLNIKINGIGTAIQQRTPAGTKVPKGQVIEVEFRDFTLGLE